MPSLSTDRNTIPPPYLIAKALTGEIRQRSSFVPGVSAKREYRIHTSRPPRLRYGGALYCKKDTGIETFHPCTSVISIVRKPRLLDCKMSAMRSSPTCSYGIGAIPTMSVRVTTPQISHTERSVESYGKPDMATGFPGKLLRKPKQPP